MKLSFKIPHIGAPHVNLLLLGFLAASLYGPILAKQGNLATTTTANLNNNNQGGEIRWDGIYYQDGAGGYRYLMYADVEECDNQDNNDNGILRMCRLCENAGRTMAGGSQISVAFLGAASVFALLRVVGLDKQLRPDTLTGPALIGWELGCLFIAFVSLTISSFIWGTNCLAAINQRSANVRPQGYIQTNVSIAFIFLAFQLVLVIKSHKELWRIRRGPRVQAVGDVEFGNLDAGKKRAPTLDVSATPKIPSRPGNVRAGPYQSGTLSSHIAAPSAMNLTSDIASASNTDGRAEVAVISGGGSGREPAHSEINKASHRPPPRPPFGKASSNTIPETTNTDSTDTASSAAPAARPVPSPKAATRPVPVPRPVGGAAATPSSTTTSTTSGGACGAFDPATPGTVWAGTKCKTCQQPKRLHS
eukprot:g70982.t1